MGTAGNARARIAQELHGTATGGHSGILASYRELIGTLSGQEWMPLLRTDCDGKATTSTRNGPRAMRHGFLST